MVADARLDRDDAQAVRDDVVQLPGDAHAFLDEEVLCPLFGLLDQASGVGAALSGGPSDRPGGGLDDEDLDHPRPSPGVPCHALQRDHQGELCGACHRARERRDTRGPGDRHLVQQQGSRQDPVRPTAASVAITTDATASAGSGSSRRTATAKTNEHVSTACHVGQPMRCVPSVHQMMFHVIRTTANSTSSAIS